MVLSRYNPPRRINCFGGYFNQDLSASTYKLFHWHRPQPQRATHYSVSFQLRWVQFVETVYLLSKADSPKFKRQE